MQFQISDWSRRIWKSHNQAQLTHANRTPLDEQGRIRGPSGEIVGGSQFPETLSILEFGPFPYLRDIWDTR